MRSIKRYRNQQNTFDGPWFSKRPPALKFNVLKNDTQLKFLKTRKGSSLALR